jgi:hypothetical protein
MTTFDASDGWVWQDKEGVWQKRVYLNTGRYVEYSGIMSWKVGDILDLFNAALEFIKEHEGMDIDPHTMHLTGKSVMGENLNIVYQRPATEEEVAAKKQADIDYKVEQKKRLLAELAELGD